MFFLDYLQTFDHLEGEAHYAALLASVPEVDGLVIVVDEDLLDGPAVVVEPLCPLWDIRPCALCGIFLFFTFLACSLIRTTSFPCNIAVYPEEAQCNPRLNVDHREG